MYLDEVVSYFRLLADEPDKTFLPDSAIIPLVKVAHQQYYRTITDVDEKPFTAYLGIQNPSQTIDLTQEPHNLLKSVSGSYAGDGRLTRLQTIGSLNNLPQTGSGGSNLVLATSDIFVWSAINNPPSDMTINLQGTPFTRSNYIDDAAWQNAILLWVVTNGGTYTKTLVTRELGFITSPTGVNWTISITGVVGGTIDDSGYIQHGHPASGTGTYLPSVWLETLGSSVNPPTQVDVHISSSNLALLPSLLASNIYQFWNLQATTINTYGGSIDLGYTLSPFSLNTYLSGACGDENIGIYSAAIPSNVLTITKVQSATSPTPSGNGTGDFYFTYTYDAAQSAKEFSKNANLLYTLTNKDLRFNRALHANNIVLVYTYYPNIDFTKINQGDEQSIDEFEEFHDIIALLMYKQYAIKDVAINPAMENQLAMRLNDLKAYIAQGQDFEGSQYVSRTYRRW